MTSVIPSLVDLLASQHFSQLSREERQNAQSAIANILAGVESSALVRELLVNIQDDTSREAIRICLSHMRYKGSVTGGASAALSTGQQAMASALLKVIVDSVAEDPVADESVTILLTELEYLAPREQLQVLCAALNAVETGTPSTLRLLRLMPKSVTSIMGSGDNEDEAVEERGSSRAKPCETSTHRDHALVRLCQASWDPQHVAGIMEAFREIPMTPAQLTSVVKSWLRNCKRASLDVLPAAVHQLLLLSARGQKALIVKVIVDLFEHRESLELAAGEQLTANLLAVEKAVLDHIATVIKYDTSLVQEWFKSLQPSTGASPSRFSLCILLSLVKHSRLEKEVLALLKKMLLASLESDTLLRPHGWEASVALASATLGPALRATLKRVTGISAKEDGHNSVLEGALVLGTHLAHVSTSEVMPLLAAVKEGCDGTSPPSVRLVLLGIDVLTDLSTSCPSTLPSSLSWCATQLGGCVSGALADALPALILLGRITNGCSSGLRDQKLIIKTCLEHLTTLPPEASVTLLVTLWPVARLRSELRDLVINTLRKTMFGRSEAARLLSVHGFLHLITEQLERASRMGLIGSQCRGGGMSQGACSQSALSQLPSLSGGAGVSLLNELLGYLRRCLGQSSDVRRALYAGLVNLVEQDPGLHEVVADLLLPHLSLLHETQANKPTPLRLDCCCTSQGTERRILEPLPELLSCLRQLSLSFAAANVPDWDGSEGDGDMQMLEDSLAMALSRRWTDIRQRMLACEAEHWGLDAGCDFNPCTSAGAINQLHVAQLLGCLEVVMEDIVEEATGPKAQATAEATGEQLARVFELHQRLSDFARNVKPSGGSKDKSKPPAQGSEAPAEGAAAGGAVSKRARELAPDYEPVDTRVTHLTAACLVKLCSAIIDDGLVAQQGAESAAMSHHTRLARDSAFIAFVLRASLRALETPSSPAHMVSIVRGALTASTTSDTSAAPRREKTVQEVLTGPLFCLAQVVAVQWACDRPVGPRRAAARARPGTTAGAAANSEPLALIAVQCIAALVPVDAGLAKVSSALAHVPVGPDAQAATDDATVAVVQVRLPYFKAMLDALMHGGAFKETQQLCGVLTGLAKLLPKQIANEISNWAIDVCQQEAPVVGHPGVVRALVALMATARGAEDLSIVRSVAEDVQRVVGTTEVESQSVHNEMPVINDKTAQHAALEVLRLCDEAQLEVERVAARLATLPAHDVLGAISQPTSAPPGAEGQGLRVGRQAAEAAVYSRMHEVVSVLSVVLNTRLGRQTVLEHQTVVVTRTYKILALLAKGLMPQKGAPRAPAPREFSVLVSSVHSTVTPALYACIADAQEGEAGAVAVSAAKMKKDQKAIPQLVFQVEEWEKQLVLLGRAVGVNFMRDAKRSANRDFKLNVNTNQATEHSSGQPRSVGINIPREKASDAKTSETYHTSSADNKENL